MSLQTSRHGTASTMPLTDDPIVVVKRDGTRVPVNPEKIRDKVELCSHGLPMVDSELVAQKAINGLYDGVSTIELDQLLMQTAAMMISEEPQYSKLAARLLNNFITGEIKTLGIQSFSDSIAFGVNAGLIDPKMQELVANDKAFYDEATLFDPDLFEYFGLRTVYDRYLLKDPKTRHVFETPRFFFMRVALGLSSGPEEAGQLFKLMNRFEYMPSTPTLFNSGTNRPQMSSCYLLDSPEDSLESIYDKYKEVALLSKYAGGIGLAYHRIRSNGSLIRGTNGKSNGIIPFLKTLDSSVSAVNQGGKRKGACCIYLETWHADILDFLALRENTGDESMRTHNLNLANWVSDLFMLRVEQNQTWSLFDPADVPHFPELYGSEFEEAYLQAERAGLAQDTIPARELYSAMMKSLAQTGNGWMTFKDASNLKANQTGYHKQNVIHLSNLCTEIIEVSHNKETAVCNLGSINLSKYIKDDGIDYDKLGKNVRTAVTFLDRVIDINFYPIESAAQSNHKWRPVGLGVMGLQDVFFKLGLAFDSPEAREISKRVSEEIYYNALWQSVELAKESGTHAAYQETKAAHGLLQFDLWGVTPNNMERWTTLRAAIKEHGLRNSLLIAIAPTATIASICGVYECIEPQISNLFKRETLSGEFLQINNYLVQDLKQHGLWNDKVRNKIKLADGSIQEIAEIPERLKQIYRTAWEVPMRSLIDMAADRGAFIDQSQSLNLFIESPTIGKLSSMYNYAWKKGLKTTYYLRSRAATRIAKATVSTDAVACSLENPESCEACQ